MSRVLFGEERKSGKWTASIPKCYSASGSRTIGGRSRLFFGEGAKSGKLNELIKCRRRILGHLLLSFMDEQRKIAHRKKLTIYGRQVLGVEVAYFSTKSEK